MVVRLHLVVKKSEKFIENFENIFLGFDNGFNRLLPFLLKICDQTDEAIRTECKSDQKDLLIISMAMQARAPGSVIGPNAMIPLLMTDDKSQNKDLGAWEISTRPDKLKVC